MNTWKTLEKELHYYGIKLINSRKCYVYNENGEPSVCGVIKTIKILNKDISKLKKNLKHLWDEIVNILGQESSQEEIIDENISKLFIFSIKDFSKYLLCFEDSEKTVYYESISKALSRDIKTFNKDQIYSIPDYKICVDLITRSISRLLYMCNLLSFASIGEKKVSGYDTKTAKGIEGPWAHLDLPLLERKYPYDNGLKERDKGKQKQNRYMKGLQYYNDYSDSCFEGHYWVEKKNEPFSWYDRNFEDPYPSRYLLSR
jgi:hypothetical protein